MIKFVYYAEMEVDLGDNKFGIDRVIGLVSGNSGEDAEKKLKDKGIDPIKIKMLSTICDGEVDIKESMTKLTLSQIEAIKKDIALKRYLSLMEGIEVDLTACILSNKFNLGECL